MIGAIPCSLSAWLLIFWVASAVAGSAAVDLNRATQAELESLPGIGPAKAEAIMAYRKQHGPFRRIEDLQRVHGFGPATVNRLRHDLCVAPLVRGSGAQLPSLPVVTKPGQK